MFHCAQTSRTTYTRGAHALSQHKRNLSTAACVASDRTAARGTGHEHPNWRRENLCVVLLCNNNIDYHRQMYKKDHLKIIFVLRSGYMTMKRYREMVRDHGNPRIAVVLFQDGYRFIYIFCTLCQDGDCDVTVRTLQAYAQ